MIGSSNREIGPAAPEQAAGQWAMYPSLRDRAVFITGGATGLGAEMVAQFAAQGARVAFVDIDEPAGLALADTIVSNGYPKPFFQSCDVRNIPQLQGAIAEVARTAGPVTALVNNAADDDRHMIDAVTVEYWDDKMAVNLRPHFFAMQTVAPMMRAAGGGSIVNLGSIIWRAKFAGVPGYASAKAAIEGLTRAMARDLGPDRVRVNCVVPGWIMTERQLTHWVTPDAEQEISRSQCLKDKLMPADVARLVLWLAADDSRMCTSQMWVVDGGWT